MDINKEYKEEIKFIVEQSDKNLPEILREFAEKYHKEQLLIHGVVSSSVKNELIVLDKKKNIFDLISKEELNVWEKDGSIEKGDMLYSAFLVKTY